MTKLKETGHAALKRRSTGEIEAGEGNYRHHESSGISKKDLRQMQSDSPARRSARDLRELEAQAEAGITSYWLLVTSN
jgi:hypothetical protein